MVLANRIREYREARGESLRDLAQAVGMDVSLLSKVERGERGCPDLKKLAIAGHYGAQITDLFFVSAVAQKSTVDDPPAPPPTTPEEVPA